jgi:hypothetical protein
VDQGRFQGDQMSSPTPTHSLSKSTPTFIVEKRLCSFGRLQNTFQRKTIVQSGHPDRFPKHIWHQTFFEPQVFVSMEVPQSAKEDAAAIEILDLEQVCWHRSCKYFGGKNTCQK